MKKDAASKIALARVKDLFAAAEAIFSSEAYKDLSDDQKQDYANRYVDLARTIAMRHTVTIPHEYKKKFCKHCYTYLRHGVNCTVRTHDGKLVLFCMACKKYTRLVYDKKSDKE
jgi:ribonuclease P protein subunit RPR2